MDSELLARLEENATPDPTTGCLLWLGPYGKDHRAVLCVDALLAAKISQARDPKYRHFTINAARLVWYAINGQIPDSLFVCHRCDQPACVSSAHLWLGTNADNMADMKAKGRARGGMKRKQPPCSHCGGKAVANNMCMRLYQRMRRTGSTEDRPMGRRPKNA